jgi:uncharacterized Zn finger protein (UPF0148 family)
MGASTEGTGDKILTHSRCPKHECRKFEMKLLYINGRVVCPRCSTNYEVMDVDLEDLQKFDRSKLNIAELMTLRVLMEKKP